MQSRAVDLDGPVHYADFGVQGPPMVCVHGLGGSHLNWIALAPALARRARVLALDLAGFGRTPLAGRRAGVHANQRLLDRFLDEVVGGPAILVGNSMGGTLAILEAAAHPERVAGLVLVCPSVPHPAGVGLDPEVVRAFAAFAVPGLGPRLLRRRRLRLGPHGLVRETMRLCCVDPGRVPRAAVLAMIDLTRERAGMPWADIAYLEAARSLVALHTWGRRRFLEEILRVAVPTLLVQGAADRLASLAAAEQVARMRPDWTFTVLDEVGHLPMLEDPRRLMAVIDAWLSGVGHRAMDGARSTPGQPDKIAHRSQPEACTRRTPIRGDERPLPKRPALPAC